MIWIIDHSWNPSAKLHVKTNWRRYIVVEQFHPYWGEYCSYKGNLQNTQKANMTRIPWKRQIKCTVITISKR